jgi:integrase
MTRRIMRTIAMTVPTEVGSPLDASNVMRRVLKKAGRRAGVPWVGFHTFRHTCATLLFRNGLNAKQVQVWLGHHSPTFRLGTYVHHSPIDLPDAGFLDELKGPSGNSGATSTHRDEPRRSGHTGHGKDA